MKNFCERGDYIWTGQKGKLRNGKRDPINRNIIIRNRKRGSAKRKMNPRLDLRTQSDFIIAKNKKTKEGRWPAVMKPPATEHCFVFRKLLERGQRKTRERYSKIPQNLILMVKKTIILTGVNYKSHFVHCWLVLRFCSFYVMLIMNQSV